MSNDSVFRNARSIGIATGVYSVSFGVLSVAAGLSVAQTCVLSLVTFTGASQFTFVSVIGAGGSIVGALAPSILLAGRNAVYALSLGGVIALALLTVTPVGVPIIAAALGAVPMLIAARRRERPRA